ncbi:TfoX/Sxy family DNA transformation protein [Paracoccus aminophilus]|nr:TfoX/Sxy family DNA transformation protein [Paracoccus aminophilus]
MTDLISITNIGPATAKSLTAAGIPDAETLRALGADEAYRALIGNGERPHFIGYYVLHMALQGRPWNDCRGKEKVDLRLRFDALVADCRKKPGAGELPHALLEALDLIGLAPAPPR